MANRYRYIDTGKEADDFVKAFVAMSKSIQDAQYNRVRLDYYRALTQKALRGSQGALSTPEGRAMWDKIMQQQQENAAQRRQWMQELLGPKHPAEEPAPKEPAPKPHSETEPAPTTPKSAETPTTPSAPAGGAPPAPSKAADLAVPEDDGAAPQFALNDAETPSLFEDDKAIPA